MEVKAGQGGIQRRLSDSPSAGGELSSGSVPTCRHCGRPALSGDADRRVEHCSDCGFIQSQLTGRKKVAPDRAPCRLPVAPDGVLRGKYRLIERLGEGAHGVTYRAEHLFLSHECVVKVLAGSGQRTSDEAIQRLRREAQAGFRVNDPQVVRVLDCDVLRGTWYFVMEYVEGVDLAEPIRAGWRMPWSQAARVALDAARGLDAIHRCSLVHRDIKPANLILATDGRVRIADLGVAGLVHGRGELEPAENSGAAGTLEYRAPEAFVAGAAVGPRADLYSLGATLYHLMVGRLPHDSGQVFKRLIDLECRPPEWPDDLRADTPAWFVSLILQLLAAEPGDRLESPAALADRLQAGAGGGQATAPTSRAETLEPRGVGVLPFRNESGAADDDWLGYALANNLSRSLAQMPGLYVADQDTLTAIVRRLCGDSDADQSAEITAAGRMVGAGTVISGSYRRVGVEVAVTAQALRVGGTGQRGPLHVQGHLADLGKLESLLLGRVLHALDVPGAGGATPGTPRSPVLEAREQFVLAKQAYLRGEYEAAAAFGQEAVRLDPQFAEAIGFIGVCLARVGRYDAAEAQHRAQERLAVEWGDGRLHVEALANLGVMSYFRGDYESALASYEKAAARAQELGLAVEEAQIANNLGFVLFRLGRPGDAERAFNRAIQTHRDYGGLTSLIGPYSGLGNVLADQERYEEALNYYRRALSLAQEVGDRASVGTTHMHVGRCAAKQQRFAEAKQEFTMALSALEETSFWNGLARAYEYITELNLQLGDLDEAVRCADKRIELARQHANTRMEQAAWQQKAESLKRAGRDDEATACLAKGRGATARDAAE